jgi:GrpB-like predicted nucleotidyltransferase (UPF0157 family)
VRTSFRQHYHIRVYHFNCNPICLRYFSSNPSQDVYQEEGYLTEQIFNVDETGLFWKRMPARTYIHKEDKSMPGFKAYKDRLTLLLGGNIAGFKLKPFLIYHSENPRAFKNVNKHTLPVYFRSQRKAWMTQGLFEDWLLNCFIPQVRERFARIERMAHDVFRPYREIYEEKKKQTIQTKLTMFMKKTNSGNPNCCLR